MNRRFPVYLLLCILFVAIVSCKDLSTEEPVTSSSNVAITSFKLAKDTGVVVNLDSVFFTIDLNKAEVFNADSLPKGSKVSKVVVTIGHPIVSSAEIIVKGGTRMKDTTINYLTNGKDSIDFTGKVTLRLVSEDKLATREYSLKVNVHNMKPDSLYWNQLSRRDLPGSGQTPIAQRTVELGNVVYCLVKEKDRHIISHTTDLASNRWIKEEVLFPFEPNIKSFTATTNKLYILSTDGNLYSSTNGMTWVSCNTTFHSIIGGFEDRVLGVVKDNDQYKHIEYPVKQGFASTTCPDKFPVKDSSPLIVYTTQWSIAPLSMMIGGVDKNGNIVGDAWGYDGSQWAMISSNPIPARSGAVLFPYFTFKTNSHWMVTKHTTWVAIGGLKSDGSTSKDVYISLDAGINWKKGDNLLQLPSYISDFTNAQAIIANTSMSASRSSNDGWEPIHSLDLPVWFMVSPIAQSRGYVQTWECPYIYMFGGENANSQLYNNIWKGVLNRLSFKPLI